MVVAVIVGWNVWKCCFVNCSLLLCQFSPRSSLVVVRHGEPEHRNLRDAGMGPEFDRSRCEHSWGPVNRDLPTADLQTADLPTANLPSTLPVAVSRTTTVITITTYCLVVNVVSGSSLITLQVVDVEHGFTRCPGAGGRRGGKSKGKGKSEETVVEEELCRSWRAPSDPDASGSGHGRVGKGKGASPSPHEHGKGTAPY